MTGLSIDDELDLIKGRKTPAQLDAEAGKGAIVPPAPAPAVPAAAKTPAEIDAELGLPPSAIGLPATPKDDAGTWDVLVAAFRAETIRTDSWNDTARRRQALAEDMFRRLPLDVQQRLTEKSWSESGGWAGLEYEVATAAADAARQGPEAAAAWAGYPLSLEAFNQQIDVGRKADIDEAQSILDQPGGGIAEFFGTAARAMTDETSVMLMPFGVTGAAWRTIAAEAILGAAGEAAVLPKEYRVARELGLPEPDPVTRITTGAIFGGGLSAALVGLGKGYRAFRARAEARRASIGETLPGGGTRVEHEAEIDAAEAELRGDQTVQERLGPGSMAGGARAEVPAAGTLGDVLEQPQPGALPAVGPDAPADWERIRNGIFAGESGADWNALYGYQNRKGGVFSTVKPTQMTVDQWLAFQDPRGPYASWVKGQIGRVATPMGAYQIVGTTLRAAKKGLGLKGDEVMTPEMQDYIAQWIYRQQGTGAWEGYKGPRDSYTPGSVDGPAPPSGPTSRSYTGSGQVKAGDEFIIDVDWEVVDAGALSRASGDLQPRDRSRVASDAWIADTAARLDPAQLMPSPTADRGAPIVGPDNVIESGNGRFGAIERAYAQHPDRALAYRNAIETAGFAVPEGVERPVLIARRRTELTQDQRSRFAIEAQDSGVAVMTPTEMARASSRAMTGPVLSRLDPGLPLRDAGNGDFVRAALAGLPRSARNAMFDASGLLNAAGERQLREAIFARAWPDPDILARYTETDAGELKSLMEALDRAAPAWAALKADIEAGLVRPEMDISAFVLDAMRLIGAARDLSRKSGLAIARAVQELLDEVDLLEGAISPLTAALVRKFWANGRAAKAEDAASFLIRYADDARKAGVTGGMFDGPTARDVLRAIDPATFGDLPEDMGAPRGQRATSEAPAEAVTDLPGQAFDQGARSPEAEAVQAEIEAALRGQEAANVADPFVALAADVDYQDAIRRQNEITPTTELPDYGTDAFWQQRRYIAHDGSELTGLSAAADHLAEVSRSLAWSEDGIPPQPVRRDRQAIILIGPPASGKSAIANPLARDRGAAILDADEAKKLIPEYGRGDGATAVHEESSEIAQQTLRRLVRDGDNLVLPKVGGRHGSIESLTALLKSARYTVQLVEVAAPADVVIGRMIGRGKATGRYIPADVLKDGIDGAPRTYQILKEKGVADGYARIDNAPERGQPRGILEDDGDILIAFRRADGGNRDAQPGETARGADPGRRDRAGQEGLANSSAELDATRPEATDPLTSARTGLGAFAEAEIELPDGTTARAGDLLDDLEADRQFDAFLQACATIPNGGSQ